MCFPFAHLLALALALADATVLFKVDLKVDFFCFGLIRGAYGYLETS